MIAAFAFVTLSLGSFCVPPMEKWLLMSLNITASGLLYASELIEEHSRLAKVIGQRSVYVPISTYFHQETLTEIVNLDNCDTSRSILLYRPITFNADNILHHLPPCLPSKLLQYLAMDFPHLNNISLILRSRYWRPFYLVFLFHKSDQQCTSIEDVSRGSYCHS